MYATAGRICAYLLVPVVLAGCGGTASRESHSPWRFPWQDDVLMTTATVRGVYTTTVKDTDEFNRIEPKRVRCTEPSPDVATAVSKSFGVGLTAAGKEPKSSIEAQLAASVASSNAQAVAQLGERLATIQLLRDGLYRACEAYANGAITPTTYTLIVSRIDDLMVTLLSTEIAGGAFGRDLAALGGSTTAAASATQAVGAASQKAVQLTKDVNDASTEVATKERELAELQAQKPTTTDLEANPDAQAEFDAKDKAKTAERDAAEAKRKEKHAALEKAVAELSVAQATYASSSAAANFKAGGGIDRAPSVEIAEQIAAIQKSYLADFNLDAIMAACVTELSQTIRQAENGESMLVKHCETLIPGVEDALNGSVELRNAELKSEVIIARADADAKRTGARAASARFALGRAIFDYCGKKPEAEQDNCVATQTKVFGLSAHEPPVSDGDDG